MIRGRVHPLGEPPISGEPKVAVTVANIDDPARTMTVEVTVDTGFSAHLTLPSETIKKLGLIYMDVRPAMLANGEVRAFPIYPARVSWNGMGRQVPVFESESQPLLGMALLWDSRLTIEAWAGGEVTIQPAI